ncbi:N-acetylmuramidase family protein [Hymenobacter sp. ASUV-10]|uniref:N-acetylmuramidase family protein n=1 Tax=Hymenobacter aranciens TaxID=3063996 RepID=A0ABT9BHI4_9BACT|nr:N-acetylmuramidase family protein [Hymenobacter sp. ASUV-10]MDO7877724.1 N-acetylmuramidase family protein [Hymenobacter sp. ASUV-10]
MSQKLTSQQLTAAATAAGFEPRAVRAVIKVETGGSGYDKTTGYLLIQFEPSWFRRLLPKALTTAITAASTAVAKQAATPAQAALVNDWVATQANGVEGQVKERLAFDAAGRIDKHTADLATSWGLPQMMGFNHQVCGYASVEAMVEAFRQSEANQLTAMLRFIKAKPVMAAALKKKDWGVFAYYYNGAGYKAFNYDKRLAKAYDSLA